MTGSKVNSLSNVTSYSEFFVRNLSLIQFYKAEVNEMLIALRSWEEFISWVAISFSSLLKNLCTLKIPDEITPQINKRLVSFPLFVFYSFI